LPGLYVLQRKSRSARLAVRMDSVETNSELSAPTPTRVVDPFRKCVRVA
jgi:hypothetical protein